MIHTIKILDAIVADSEADVEAVKTLSGRDARALCDYSKGVLVLTAADETGACDITVDSIQVSWNNSDWLTVQTGIALQFTAAGVKAIAMSGSYGLPLYIKLLITVGQISGDHKFGSFTAELQFGTN